MTLCITWPFCSQVSPQGQGQGPGLRLRGESIPLAITVISMLRAWIVIYVLCIYGIRIHLENEINVVHGTLIAMIYDLI